MNLSCHGLAACISLTSPKCGACSSAHSCASLALLDLELSGDLFGIGAERQRLNLFAQRSLGTPSGEAKGMGDRSPVANLTSLAPRVASQVKRLSGKGWFAFARQELQLGRNPAEKGWRKVFCRLLLERRCSRHALHHALMSELGMTDGSARAQASVAISIMAAGRLAVEVRGQVRFTPN